MNLQMMQILGSAAFPYIAYNREEAVFFRMKEYSWKWRDAYKKKIEMFFSL